MMQRFSVRGQCLPRRRVASLAIVAIAATSSTAAAAADDTAERVSINEDSAGIFRVVSSLDGTLGFDGTIRGAGGSGYMEAARSAGADAMRTWGLDTLEEELERAADLDLRISAGMWLPHGASWYENCSDLDSDERWNRERERYLAAVRLNKNSSGLLWWTVGNEMELEVNVWRGNECVWKRVEWVAEAVKLEDPDHPVGTVLAGAMKQKVQLLDELCPSLDFLGINSYGDGSLFLGDNLKAWNFSRPYAIMEFGPTGHWMSPQTEWGAFIEESSSEKVPRYNATCYSCYDDPKCIGAFAFVWGWKWEKTGTWYNMFNEWEDVTRGVAVECHNCESEVLEALEACWTGSHRDVRPPTIHGVRVDGEALENFSFVLDRSASHQLSVDATHPLGDPLVAIWAVTEDVVSNAIGGAWEATNPLLAGLWPSSGANPTTDFNATTGTGLNITLNTSALKAGGEYRLYVFARENPEACGSECRDQEAYASLPFRICHTAVQGEACHRRVAYALERGIRDHPALYPGVDQGASFEEVQMLLHQQGFRDCPPPCGIREWCATSTQGEACHDEVQWLLEQASDTPENFPEQLQEATFEDAQNFVQKKMEGVCPKACARSEEDSQEADEEAEVSAGTSAGAHYSSVLIATFAVSASVAASAFGAR